MGVMVQNKVARFLWPTLYIGVDDVHQCMAAMMDCVYGLSSPSIVIAINRYVPSGRCLQWPGWLV